MLVEAADPESESRRPRHLDDLCCLGVQVPGSESKAMLASSLLDFVEYLEKADQKLPSLRRVVGSGDSVPLHVQSRFHRLLGCELSISQRILRRRLLRQGPPLRLFGWPVLEGCGITEIGGYFATQPIGKEKPGSIGRPTAGTEVSGNPQHVQ